MIQEKLNKTISSYNLFNEGDRVVAGVSGGPDSVALLYLLNDLKKVLGLKLYVAHLDHMLRRGSSKDAEFVKKLAQKLGLPAIIGQINVKRIAQKGSIEEIARNARLGFLFRVAKENKARKIALAHNMDDQAETVLMRILRGSGLYGLAGILPKRKLCGFEIVRPLIEISRKEIEAFLRRKKISVRIDPSNLQDIYFRNKIRNKLLPLLQKEYNKNIKEVLANMGQSAGFDYDYLAQIAESKSKGMRKRLSIAKLLKMHPALRRLIIRQAIKNAQGSTRRINFQHIKEIEDLLANRPDGAIVNLPKNTCVVKKKPYLNFYIR
ncbi:MAG: tRNA lysidine(34) synthetase TilS [Candidatus Omnitrophota bacterium]